MLLNYLINIARKRGLEGFTAWVLTSNTAMMRIFKKLGNSVSYRINGDLYEVTIKFLEDGSS